MPCMFQGDHMSMDQQLANFHRTVRQMRRILRGNSSRVHDHLSKCIYYVGMGSNDYLNNYFMPNLYPTSLDYSPKTYAAVLIADYKRQLTVSKPSVSPKSNLYTGHSSESMSFSIIFASFLLVTN